MIIAVSIENAHLYQDVIPSIYRLRHRGFKQRQNYDVPEYNGMEYDVYDTPATTYLAWRDEKNVVRGCARLFPTTLPYMVEELWPETVIKIALPKSPKVMEASRLCIDKDLPVETRKRIQTEILCALQEFGLSNGINWMIGVMSPPVWKAVFIRAGWPIEFLGLPLELKDKELLGNRDKIYTGKMPISEEILQELRNNFGISGTIIENNVAIEFEEAA